MRRSHSRWRHQRGGGEGPDLSAARRGSLHVCAGCLSTRAPPLHPPPPAGAISEGEVKAQIWALLLGGIGVAYALDTWAGHDFPIMTALAAGGSFISYIYSGKQPSSSSACRCPSARRWMGDGARAVPILCLSPALPAPRTRSSALAHSHLPRLAWPGPPCPADACRSRAAPLLCKHPPPHVAPLSLSLLPCVQRRPSS